MKLPAAPRVPRREDFGSPLHSPAVAARVGVWLGACFGIAFLTGLVSHFAQTTPGWLTFPTRPVSLYRVTQGLHVLSGTAAIPLLLVKLWTVYPRFFLRPGPRLRQVVVHVLERASVGILVAAAIFELASGLLNSTQWYPWHFGFRRTHYAVGWLAIGALVLHISVKLPVIRTALGLPISADVGDGGAEPPNQPAASGSPEPSETSEQPEPVGISRRSLVRTALAASAVAVVATAGATVPLLRRVSVFGVRSGQGPQGVPINKSALAAHVTDLARHPGYRLTVVNGSRTASLSLDELNAMRQYEYALPISCVEGWSASGMWGGVRIKDLLTLVGAPSDSNLKVVSLQPAGAFAVTHLPSQFTRDDLTLLALRLAGQTLDIDHGYPCRLIAPDRPGVLQTKWVERLEVVA